VFITSFFLGAAFFAAGVAAFVFFGASSFSAGFAFSSFFRG
jgi:hypothetical protein